MTDFLSLWLRLVPAYAAGYFLSYGLRSVNAVIAPELMQELGIGATGLGLLTSAYFLAFGLFQLPLGLLLDRFGPRRVEAVLLLVAALGASVFAMGTSLQALAVGRALIGLGVSACLMASFKAFSQWFPVERLPSLTATVMVAGGLGALSASVPVTMALPLIGWRGVFWLVAGLLVLASAYLMSVPDHPSIGKRETLGQQIRSLRSIYGNRVFWRFAPQGCLVMGGFMAFQGLWAVPWLMEVNGATRGDAAGVLFLMSLAMLAGFLFVATCATGLARRGITPCTTNKQPSVDWKASDRTMPLATKPSTAAPIPHCKQNAPMNTNRFSAVFTRPDSATGNAAVSCEYAILPKLNDKPSTVHNHAG